MRAPNTLTTPLAGRASSSTFSVFRSKFRPRSSSSAPQPSHAPSPSPSPPPSISPSLKPWGPKWASGRTEHSSEIQTKPLLPPPPHQGGEASVPSQQRLQEFGEACGRGGGKTYQGGWRKSEPLPPASVATDKPTSTATQPAPARNTVQRLAEALRLIRTGSAAGKIRSVKSHRLLSHAPDVSSWRRKTARELAPIPPWPPKVGNSGVSQTPWCHGAPYL